jgi:alkylhydroperoxidase/carboxymuconolactone decarboxylase family protein YurZ
VKLALAIGAGSEDGVHSHCRRAIEEGVSREALKQVALLASSLSVLCLRPGCCC